MSNSLPFVVFGDDDVKVRNALPGAPPAVAAKVLEINLRVVESGIERIVRGLSEALDNVTATSSSYEISTVEIAIAVTASGEFGLLGTAKGGLEGGSTFTLTLSRKKP